jgi:hypothetical protein
VTQADLFGEPGLPPRQQVIAAEKREQEQEIRRVYGNLREAILAFCAQVRRQNQDGALFTATALRDFVACHAPSAPGSPDRILRLMRQEGHLNYRVVSRSGSLYELLFMEESCPVE